MDMIKTYKMEISTGVASLVLGLVSKKALSMETIKVDTLKHAASSFVVAFLAASVGGYVVTNYEDPYWDKKSTKIEG